MSRTCDITGKSAISITPRKLLRGNWNPTGKKRKYPNLQTVRYPGGKLKVSTRALKDLKRKAKEQNITLGDYIKMHIA